MLWTSLICDSKAPPFLGGVLFKVDKNGGFMFLKQIKTFAMKFVLSGIVLKIEIRFGISIADVLYHIADHFHIIG